MRSPLIVTCACVTIVLTARPAAALGPLDVEAAATAGYGTNLARLPTNPLAFGIGARAGASLLGIYAGAQVAYSFGTGPANYLGEYRVFSSSLKVGGDLGYGFRIAPVTLRPRLGAGDLVMYTSETGPVPCTNCQIGVRSTTSSGSEDFLYLDGGLTVLVPVSPLFFVGADADLLVLPNPIGGICCDELKTAFTFDGEVGVRF